MRKSYLWIRSFYWLGAILDVQSEVSAGAPDKSKL
ncbi:hypothetical protein SRRS_35250 [Sporomusa rhizae]